MAAPDEIVRLREDLKRLFVEARAPRVLFHTLERGESEAVDMESVSEFPPQTSPARRPAGGGQRPMSTEELNLGTGGKIGAFADKLPYKAPGTSARLT